jgi:transcriptional regulator with GAF, ATPase, and Fis domain
MLEFTMSLKREKILISFLGGPSFRARVSAGKNKGNRQTESPDLSFSDAVARFEMELLRKALRSSKYNQRHAAHRLGLTYDQFRGLYRKYRAQLEQSWNSTFPPNR